MVLIKAVELLRDIERPNRARTLTYIFFLPVTFVKVNRVPTICATIAILGANRNYFYLHFI